MKTKPVLALAVIAALLCTASILAGLRHRLARHDKPAPAPEPHAEPDATDAERARVRAALADILAPPIDFNKLPPHLRPRPGMPTRDELRESLPRNPRPAWQDLREMRDSSW